MTAGKAGEGRHITAAAAVRVAEVEDNNFYKPLVDERFMAGDQLVDRHNKPFEAGRFYRHVLLHGIYYVPESGEVLQNCWKEPGTPLENMAQAYASQLVPIDSPEDVERNLRNDANFIKKKMKEAKKK